MKQRQRADTQAERVVEGAIATPGSAASNAAVHRLVARSVLHGAALHALRAAGAAAPNGVAPSNAL